jgi:hypothetical protein
MGDAISWWIILHHEFTWREEYTNTPLYKRHDLNLPEKSDAGRVGTAFCNRMTFRVAGNWTIAANHTGSDCFGLL